MLKSLSYRTILTTFENGIKINLRQLNRTKMQDLGRHQNSHQIYFNDNRENVNEFRKWVTVTPEPKKPGHAFSVLNYNILSQQLLEMHSYLYNNHANQALHWNQRFHNLVGEILHNQPDILCCQVKTHCTIDIYRCHLQFLWPSNLSGSAKVSLDGHSAAAAFIELRCDL